MTKNPIIRTISAFVLLLLFTFSITPRLYLHNAFASHKDVIVYASPDGHDQLSKTEFSCDTHSQVAESPYFNDVQMVHLEPPVVYLFPVTTHLPALLHLQIMLATDLRGPPARS